MTILVTGGCGFIGSKVVEYLLNKGQQVKVLDNLSTGSLRDYGILNKNLKVINQDIRYREVCFNACSGVDSIVHLAANGGVHKSVNNPRYDLESNVVGIFNMLEAAVGHGIKRFVFSSTGSVIGEYNGIIHEELPTHPVSPYAASKIAGESYCSVYSKIFGLETVTLRFGNAYGIGVTEGIHLIPAFITKTLKGHECEIFGDGSHVRDYIYMDDLIEAIYYALITPNIGGELFQIATSKGYTVNEIVGYLKTLFKDNYRLEVKTKNIQPRLGDNQTIIFNTEKAKRILGWETKTSLYDGLKQTIQWYVDNEHTLS